MALKFSGYMQTLLTMLQFPEDIARRYVLLLDPMLGEKPDLLNCASRLLQKPSSNWRLCHQGGRGAERARCPGKPYNLHQSGTLTFHFDFFDHEVMSLAFQIAAPEGLGNFCSRFPQTRVVRTCSCFASTVIRTKTSPY